MRKGNSVSMEKPRTNSHVRFIIRGYCLEELLGYGKVTSLYRARTEGLWQAPEVVMTLLHIPRDILDAGTETVSGQIFARG